MKVKVKLSAKEYESLARLIQVIPGDLFECPVDRAAQTEGLKSIFKKLQARIIDGLQPKMSLSLTTHEAWAFYSIAVALPRNIFDPYQNQILTTLINSIHQKYA